jgi:hypothetical protein
MKKIYAQCALLCALSNVGFAQFTINGNMNEAGYTTTISKQNANSCFGSNIDISAIKIGKDASNVYVGVVGKLDIETNNNIMLLIDFSQLSGVPSLTPLDVPMAGGPFEKNFSVAMNVDYMIRMNPGGSMGSPSSNCYVNALKRTGGNLEGYLGNAWATTVPMATGGGVFNAPGVDMSFSNAGSATSGFEIKIPFTAVGITSSSTIRVFAVVVSNSGYFSNVTVPGNAGATCLGFDGAGSGNDADKLKDVLFGASFVSSAIALPIELTTFTAKANNSTINLAWQTASEKGNSHFDIERSANGKDWAKIGMVKGSGTSQQKVDYRFTDEGPLSILNYYRLKQVDFDGQFNYSNVVTAVVGKGKLKGIFPNPTTDKVTLVGNDLTNDDLVTIFDLNGRNVKTQKVSGSQIDVSDLAKGFYILSISDINGQSVDRVRFVKQ